MKYVKLISFSGNLCYQQSLLLWAYLHGEKLFLVGGLPTLPCCILPSSLACPFKRLCCFVHWHSLFRLTALLQDLGCIPISIYMLFTGSWLYSNLDLHVIYRILTVSLFYLHVICRIVTVSFPIYMLFTESWQSPFFWFTWLLSTGSWQSPFFDLHVIYMILTVSLFQFTCYLQGLDGLPFFIYMSYTESSQSSFFFTCYLQDLDRLPFSIYMLFTGSWQSAFFIYVLFTESW